MFYIFLVVLILEQIFYIFPNPYPYKYGFVVRRIKLRNSQVQNSEKFYQMHNRGLLIKTSHEKDVYLRYRYTKLVGGPLLFTGRIKKQIDILEIRTGYCSSSFLIYLIGISFFPIGLNTVVIILCVVCMVWFSYSTFRKRVDSLIAK